MNIPYCHRSHICQYYRQYTAVVYRKFDDIFCSVVPDKVWNDCDSSLNNHISLMNFKFHCRRSEMVFSR